MKRMMHVVVLLTLFAGLTVSTVKAGKPAPGPVNTPVRVTIHSYDDAGLPTRIRGDGGDYVNGQDGVIANLETDGNLAIRQIGTNRRVFFDTFETLPGFTSAAVTSAVGSDPAYGVPLLGGDAGGTVESDYWYLVTLLIDQYESNEVPIQGLAKGATKCVRISTSFESVNDASLRYRMAYQRTAANGFAPGPGNSDQEGTAWGIVTRTQSVAAGDPVDEWTMVPGTGSCSPTFIPPPIGESAARILEMVTTTVIVRNRPQTQTTTTNKGRFDMPFKITLTKL